MSETFINHENPEQIISIVTTEAVVYDSTPETITTAYIGTENTETNNREISVSDPAAILTVTALVAVAIGPQLMHIRNERIRKQSSESKESE